MPAVLDAIISLAPNYIQFPYRDLQQAEIKRGFHAIAGFPNIIGAIDCTHIAIKAPSTNELNYVNRKGFHPVNVQWTFTWVSISVLEKILFFAPFAIVAVSGKTHSHG